MSMFGTANLDMRSLWLNYEVTLLVYGPEFAQALHALQQTISGSDSDRSCDPGHAEGGAHACESRARS